MTRVVTFTDGFTSGSAPSLTGGEVNLHTLSNNTADTSLGTFVTETEYTTVFIEYEIQRSVTGTLYRQAGTMIARFDGTTYSLTAGNYVGDDMLITSGAPTGNQVELYLAESGTSGIWLLFYSTGDLAGTSHACTVKLSTTKIRAS
jgi:hypothetical protein